MKIMNKMAQEPIAIRRAMLNDRNVPRAARASTIALLAFASFLWLSATVDANAAVMMGNGASTVDATGVLKSRYSCAVDDFFPRLSLYLESRAWMSSHRGWP